MRAEPAPDHLQAGIGHFTRGQYAQAEAELRQASGPEASAYLAGALARQKKYAEAEAPARAALEASPVHEVAVAALGESLVGQKKHDPAIERMSAAIAAKMVGDFETFLRLAPKAPEAATVEQLLASLK
jgi:tetratricopeptide (TPR) repeat protein